MDALLLMVVCFAFGTVAATGCGGKDKPKKDATKKEKKDKDAAK